MEVQSVDDETYLNKLSEIIENHSISLTEEKILDLLQIRYRWARGSIETINACGRVSMDYYSNDGSLDFYKWKKLYDLGFTSHITDVMDVTSELRELDNKLFEVRGSRTISNFYIGKGNSTSRVSFPPHNHDYHVIVKPIYGVCTWLIGNETQKVGPGDIIVLPSYTPHAVLDAPEPRLSLTLNLTG